MAGLPLLFKLLLAHFAADFVLQPSWVVERRSRSVLNLALVYHLLIHLACLGVLLLFDLNWKFLALILVSHGIIDMGKAAFEIRLNRHPVKNNLAETDWRLQTWGIYGFILDQLLHLAVIALVWLAMTDQGAVLLDLQVPDRWWLIALAYLVVTKPTGIFIGKLVKRWYDQILTPTSGGIVTIGLGGLPNAGSWIGIIERVLTLSFILADSYEAIGFLLAAKSILRIGDLKDDKEHKKTEYILIGTLLSFGITIVLGLALVLLLRRV